MYQTTEYLLVRRDGKVVCTSTCYEEVKNWFDFYTRYCGSNVYHIETRALIHED